MTKLLECTSRDLQGIPKRQKREILLTGLNYKSSTKHMQMLFVF